VVAGKKKHSGYTRKQNFFFSSRTPKWALGPPSFLCSGYQGFLRG